MPRERKLQIVEKRGKIYARTTYVGLDGKRHAIWRAGKNKTAAKDNLREALRDLEREGDGAMINAKRTFGDLAAWYSKRYLIPPEYRDGRVVKGKRSWQNETYQLKAIVAYFGGYKLRSISHGELEKYKEHRLATPIVFERKDPKAKGGKTVTHRNRTITTVNRELMAIRVMLRKAQKEGWLLRIPFEEHDPLINVSDERRRDRTLSYEEEARLLASVRDFVRPILVCALATGMRLGEILKLAWPDVDLDNRLIRIRSTNTKTQDERYAPITAPLLAELKSLKATALPDAERVFGIKSNIKRSFRSACERAGIKHGGVDGLTFHSLRHTAATRMIKQGMDITAVAKILGHRQVSTTYRYVSADSDILDRAREALSFRPQSSSQTADEKTPHDPD